MLITVFTPTYNRGYKISDLYKSLMSQTKYNFEWLIIDDGSIDNTKEIVSKFNSNGKFDIRYILKENGGKHTAINRAAHEAKGEYIFIVDSDDILTYDAIEKASIYLKSIRNKSDFCGVSGLRGNLDGKVWMTGDLSKIRNNGNDGINEDFMDVEYIDATAIEYRFCRKISGDRAEIVKTDLLKEFQFPVFEGERFLGEGYLWLTLSLYGYKFRWFNEVIYITEYLDDGLTQNGKEIAKQNWQGRCFSENFKLNIREIPIKEKVKSCINYYRYGLYGGRKVYQMFKKCNNKFLSLICIPIALVKAIE